MPVEYAARRADRSRAPDSGRRRERCVCSMTGAGAHAGRRDAATTGQASLSRKADVAQRLEEPSDRPLTSNECVRPAGKLLAKSVVGAHPKGQERASNYGFGHEANLDADLIEEEVRVAIGARDFFNRTMDNILRFRGALTGHSEDCQVVTQPPSH